MTAPASVGHLVEKFHDERDYLRAASTKEHLIRRAYIDPLFTALGWNLDYSEEAPLVYREVVEEDALRVEGAMKAPDYAFRIDGHRKFFVEAKKPSVNLQDGHAAAFQVRRYGWSAKLPVSILTDFEEFAVYDCRVRPDPGDQSSTARITFLGYEEYLDRWDEIADLFSRDAVLAGSLEAFEQEKSRRGTSPVDQAFLAEIEGWRELLAKEIYRKNQWISRRELNYAVQMTIDRLIFLRICEDRGIEDYGQIEELLKTQEIYKSLCKIFRDADDRYNSGLFHFREEKGREESPDGLTLRLEVEDKPLKRIIRKLYYPASPYQFSVMPVEILGQVYEQFLGKVISITPRHSAVIEEKPEVRKAGGVYYTPAYIVDYIVRDTVGKLVEGKTPRQVSRLKIVDAACGSGSFLIGAYDYLLDWHRQWYVEDGPDKHRKRLYTGPGGEWRLVNEEKKQILKNNIFGVDIDPQAVEVTKLSLLLKVLEGETDQTIMRQLSGMQERALPDLDDNIKCGNSLIGPDFYDKIQMSFLDEEEQHRINAFPWQEAFPEVFNGQSPGFDAVIGNPPYLRIQGLQEYYETQIPYLLDHYRSAVKRFDLYLLFAEKGFDLLRRGGRLGFICPHKFLNSDFGSGLREYLLANSAIEAFVSFGNNLIFGQASTYTGILTLWKGKNTSLRYYEFEALDGQALRQQLSTLDRDNFAAYDLQTLSADPWVLTSGRSQGILKKLLKQSFTIKDVFDKVLVGVQSGIDDIHVLRDYGASSGGLLSLFSERANTLIEVEQGLVKPFLRGEDLHRYAEPHHSFYCIYPYELVDDKTTILSENQLKRMYPLGYAYLNSYREELKQKRIKQKTNPKYWYSCHRSRDMRVFEMDRIATPEISLGGNMTTVPAGLYHNTMVYSLVPSSSRSEHLDFWLGVLNSKLLWWYLTNTGNVLRGGYFRFKTNYLNPFPVCTIDFTNPDDVALHDRVVALVEKMMELHQRLSAARSPTDRNFLQRQISATDHQIDRLVYELYGLTDEEIAIVEKETSPTT